MNFELKKTKNKTMASYRSLYISDRLIEKIEKIANDNDTSFNNVVVSMIEYCLEPKENNQ